MTTDRILLAGATGAVGSEVLRLPARGTRPLRGWFEERARRG